MYQITDYTRRRAKEIGVSVEPSKKKDKKLDVYKDGKYLASIGAISFKDYPTYIKENGREYADERRRLYYLRHTKDTLGELLALYLLW